MSRRPACHVASRVTSPRVSRRLACHVAPRVTSPRVSRRLGCHVAPRVTSPRVSRRLGCHVVSGVTSYRSDGYRSDGCRSDGCRSDARYAMGQRCATETPDRMGDGEVAGGLFSHQIQHKTSCASRTRPCATERWRVACTASRAKHFIAGGLWGGPRGLDWWRLLDIHRDSDAPLGDRLSGTASRGPRGLD